MARKSLLQRQKRPNVDSLRGREAGTSTRNKKGVQVGSKARRKKGGINPTQGVMAPSTKKAKKKSMAQKLGNEIGKKMGINYNKKKKVVKKKRKPTKQDKVYSTGRKYKF